MDLQVADDPGQERFEIHADGELAGVIQYHLRGHEIAFVHTETDDRFRGLGIGSHLVRSALDSVRQRNLVVLPYCPFVNRWMTEHHEYADMVPADRWARFGL
jgi:uncharacterized protein